MKLKSYLNDTDENITKEVKHVHHQHRTQYKKRERENNMEQQKINNIYNGACKTQQNKHPCHILQILKKDLDLNLNTFIE